MTNITNILRLLWSIVGVVGLALAVVNYYQGDVMSAIYMMLIVIVAAVQERNYKN